MYVTSDSLLALTLRPLVFCASAHILIVTLFIWNLFPVSFHLEVPPTPIPLVHVKPLDPKAQLIHRVLHFLRTSGRSAASAFLMAVFLWT